MLTRDVDPATDIAALDVRGNTVLSTRDLDNPFNAGPRILIGRTLNECFQIEGSYFNLKQWDDTAAVRDVDSDLISPYISGTGLNANSLIEIRGESYLQSAEINLRQSLPMPPGRMAASYLIGFRYVGIDERFGYGATTLAGLTNRATASVENDLYGLQIGGLVEFYKEPCWWINFEVKGAICHNPAVLNTRYTNLGDAAGRFTGHASENSTAFLGDIALNAVFRYNENIAARLGYQAIWIDGIAVAADNFLANRDVNTIRLGPTQIDTKADVVYHGPFAGLEVAW